MKVGRPSLGSGHVESLDGGRLQKERLAAILDALAGQVKIEDVCRRVGLRSSRFHELRGKALQAALDGLAPGPVGRPPKVSSEESARLAALERENLELRKQLQAARVRTEIALVMPHFLRSPEKGGTRGRKRKRVTRCGTSGA